MKAPACTIQTQAEAVCELFGGKKEEIKVIGIRHGEKMYETLLTNEECAKAIDMGNFYRVPADNRGLNYDKYFKDGDAKRNTLTEFNSNNTKLLNLEETKETFPNCLYSGETGRRLRTEIPLEEIEKWNTILPGRIMEEQSCVSDLEPVRRLSVWQL